MEPKRRGRPPKKKVAKRNPEDVLLEVTIHSEEFPEKSFNVTIPRIKNLVGLYWQRNPDHMIQTIVKKMYEEYGKTIHYDIPRSGESDTDNNRDNSGG